MPTIRYHDSGKTRDVSDRDARVLTLLNKASLVATNVPPKRGPGRPPKAKVEESKGTVGAMTTDNSGLAEKGTYERRDLQATPTK